MLWGVHFALWILLSLNWVGFLPVGIDTFSVDRLRMAWQWCTYGVCVCTFHLLEFGVTAISNPTVVSADSFLVNHSLTYTAAALTSWTEFGLRVALVPSWNYPSMSVCVALPLVLLSQMIRSLAMATAGESFNHLIQTTKKENHVLITHGIYKLLRHPSYVGFYYWSVGTQLLLGNILHAAAFAVVSWVFFNRRIAYEEESLCLHFPHEYPAYVARSWMGIPFLFTKVEYTKTAMKDKQ
jgi:protein-S-isoprenylcysteine O-methyltransferase